VVAESNLVRLLRWRDSCFDIEHSLPQQILLSQRSRIRLAPGPTTLVLLLLLLLLLRSSEIFFVIVSVVSQIIIVIEL